MCVEDIWCVIELKVNYVYLEDLAETDSPAS
jgi:hypothetical protein